MQGIERAQGNRMTINQRHDLEIAATNIGCEISQGGALTGGIDLAGVRPPLQQARNSTTATRLIRACGHLARNTSKSTEPASSM
jgi:hypothetical protein